MRRYERLKKPTKAIEAKMLNKINKDDIGPRWQQWPAELNWFYAGMGQRRNRRARYMYARALVLCNGIHPAKATKMALEYVDKTGKLKIDDRKRALHWAKETTQLMLNPAWGTKQHSYWDTLAQEFRR